MFLNRRVASHCWDLIFGWSGRQIISLRMSVVEHLICTKMYNVKEYSSWTKRSFVRFYVVYTLTNLKTFGETCGLNLHLHVYPKLKP